MKWDLNRPKSGVKFLEGVFLSLPLHLLELYLALESSLEPSPRFFNLFVLVEVGSEGRGQVVQLSLVFLSHLSQGDAGGVLLVN